VHRESIAPASRQQQQMDKPYHVVNVT